jgi:hypothetical protein
MQSVLFVQGNQKTLRKSTSLQTIFLDTNYRTKTEYIQSVFTYDTPTDMFYLTRRHHRYSLFPTIFNFYLPITYDMIYLFYSVSQIMFNLYLRVTHRMFRAYLRITFVLDNVLVIFTWRDATIARSCSCIRVRCTGWSSY